MYLGVYETFLQVSKKWCYFFKEVHELDSKGPITELSELIERLCLRQL